MRFTYNLLYRDPSVTLPEAPVFREEGIPDDVMAILTDPRTTVEDALYRREILADFRAFPFLAERLSDLGQRIRLLREATEKVRRQQSEGESRAMLLDDLQRISRVLLEHLRFIRQLKGLFDGADIASDGLRSLRDVFLALSGETVFETLWHGCSAIPMLSEASLRADFELQLRHDGSVRFPSVAALGTSVEARANPLKKIFNRRKETHLPLSAEDPTVLDLTCDGLRDLITRFLALTGVMDNCFTPLAPQIAFYIFALQYEKCVNDAKIPFCFPEFEAAEHHIFAADKLYNFTDACENPDTPVFHASADCTNAVFLAADTKNGALYLEALEQMQLFGAAGLGVCGENVRISGGHRILRVDGEGDTVEDCGRAISARIREADANTLVFVRHPFRDMSVYAASRAFYCHIQVFSRSPYHTFCTCDLPPVLREAADWRLPKPLTVCEEAVLGAGTDVGVLYGLTADTLCKKQV